MQTKDILNQLRERTRPHHKSIEGSIPVLREDLSPDLYQKILERFYGFYKPLEEELSAIFQERDSFNFEERKKIPLLEKDLQFLGVSTQGLRALKICPDVPTPSGWASALGILYVLEGSTLGGQIISKHINRKLGLNEDSGVAFYTSYGTATMPKWREFQEVLKADIQEEPDHEEAVAMAQRTFSELEKWMASSPFVLAQRGGDLHK